MSRVKDLYGLYCTKHIRIRPWSALSPVLSPIEQLWYQLGRRSRNVKLPKTLQGLLLALMSDWTNILQLTE